MSYTTTNYAVLYTANYYVALGAAFPTWNWLAGI